MDVGGVLREIKTGHVLRQRRGHGSLGVILLLRGQLPCLNFFQRRHQRFRAHGADTVKQFAARLLGVNGDRFHHQNIAGVQSFIELHDGHTGPGIAI